MITEGMKKYLYSYRNKVASVFYPPFVKDEHQEIVVAQLKRTVAIDNEAAKNLRHLELYIVGIFDDVKGDIEPCCNYLIDIDDLLVKEDGNNG